MAEDLFDDIEIFSEDENIEEEQNSELFEHFRFVADKGQGLMRVDKYLTMHIVGISRNRIQQAAEAGCVLVNDIAVSLTMSFRL